MKCCIHVLSNVLAMSLHNYNFFLYSIRSILVCSLCYHAKFHIDD